MGEAGLWQQVAAPGTDPGWLARAVGRLLLPGGPRQVARLAVERSLRRGTEAPGRVLAPLLPRPGEPAVSAGDAVARAWADLEVRAAVVGDPAYPVRLARGWPTSGAPVVLAWRGPDTGVPDRPAVAVVGARRASAYGTGVAAWLAEAAGAAGVLVISGGAVGVDSAAHEAACGTPGGTAVVLGCGHDVAYPRANARPGGLFDRILTAAGLLVGELLPGTPPRPPNILARNRIVAGLADAVVVVEGSSRSGSLDTAAKAAERGVPVLAVPGDVRAPGSAAPHRLLAEGATPCTEPADLLEILADAAGGVGAGHEDDGEAVEVAAGSGDGGGGRQPAALTTLPEALRGELARCWPRPARVADLAAATGLPAGRVLAAVTRARVAGELAEGPEGVRLRRAPGASPPP